MCIYYVGAICFFTSNVSFCGTEYIGVGYKDRALKALKCGIATSLCVAIFIGSFTFFQGNILANIFTKDVEVIEQAFHYLKAYAIDTLFTAILFCYIGYYNGCGNTLFVMVQGIVGAFCVRVPMVFLMSNLPNATLFHIGLATPMSSVVQIILCVIFMIYTVHAQKKNVTY